MVPTGGGGSQVARGDGATRTSAAAVVARRWTGGRPWCHGAAVTTASATMLVAASAARTRANRLVRIGAPPLAHHPVPARRPGRGSGRDGERATGASPRVRNRIAAGSRCGATRTTPSGAGEDRAPPVRYRGSGAGL